MTAALDLIIIAGAPLDASTACKWGWEIDGVAVNLTGYTARAQVRSTWDSATKLLDLNTGNGKIVITPASGLVELAVAASDTSALWTTGLRAAGQWNGRTQYALGVWDLELVNASGVPNRLLQGAVYIVPEVTK